MPPNLCHREDPANFPNSLLICAGPRYQLSKKTSRMKLCSRVSLDRSWANRPPIRKRNLTPRISRQQTSPPWYDESQPAHRRLHRRANGLRQMTILKKPIRNVREWTTPPRLHEPFVLTLCFLGVVRCIVLAPFHAIQNVLSSLLCFHPRGCFSGRQYKVLHSSMDHKSRESIE